MIYKYSDDVANEKAREWISRNPNEIENSLKNENEMIDCIETFYTITSLIRRDLNIIINFINQIFNNVSNETVIYILTNWYKMIHTNEQDGNKNHHIAKCTLWYLDDEKILNYDRLKKLFLQISDELILGGKVLGDKFVKRKLGPLGYSKGYDVVNYCCARLIISYENKELYLYIPRDNEEKRISFSDIIECNEIIEIKNSVLNIIIKDEKYPKITLNFPKSMNFRESQIVNEEIRKIKNIVKN